MPEAGPEGPSASFPRQPVLYRLRGHGLKDGAAALKEAGGVGKGRRL